MSLSWCVLCLVLDGAAYPRRGPSCMRPTDRCGRYLCPVSSDGQPCRLLFFVEAEDGLEGARAQKNTQSGNSGSIGDGPHADPVNLKPNLPNLFLLFIRLSINGVRAATN
nr:hypothetical protein [Pandoravirus belohorizontensis]